MYPVAASVLLAITMVMEAKLDAELGRFPPREVTNAWLDFSNKHLDWIENGNFGHALGKDEEYYLNWLMEAIQSKTTWGLLQNAQNRTLGITFRNCSFIELRDALG